MQYVNKYLSRYLQEQDIENLKRYKYTPGKYTWLDDQMSVFWVWIVEYLPRDLAPNLITVYALISSCLPAFAFVFYDPTMLLDYPSIMYIVAAIGIFLYQTLDAVDGKQARRIQAFSPLGQLFDHGCDSFSTAVMVIHLLVCFKLPGANLNLAMYLSYITLVYMSNMTEHFTGVMQISMGQFGVTELQLTQCGLLLAEALGWLKWMQVPICILG